MGLLLFSKQASRISEAASSSKKNSSYLEEGYIGPGLPKKKVSDLPKVDLPERWEFSAHPHDAKKSGLHVDVRLGDPVSGIAHSFVIPKTDKLPEPGSNVRVIPTFDHKIPYMDFTGTISTPYGKGEVIPGRREVAEVYHSTPEKDPGTKVRFNLYSGSHPEEFAIRKDERGRWYLHNKTQTRERRPDIPDYKPKYKEVSVDSIDPSDESQAMMPKLDGAHGIIDLKAGRSPRVYSYRVGVKTPTGLIEHTHKIPELLKTKVPKELDGTIIRAEILGRDKDGKAIPAQEIGGLLNSKVWESRKKQEQSGVKLWAFPFDVVKHKGKDVSHLPFEDKVKILKKVEESFGPVELPEIVSGTLEKIELLNKIRSKAHPLTEEGVVLIDPKKPSAPIKAKFSPDFDVFVRDIHPAISGKTGEKHDRAGSISYSWTPNGPIVGQLGGFSHGEAREMIKNPDRYIGRVAKVKAMKVFKSESGDPGALFQPRFKEWHLDKGDIEKSSAASMLTKVSEMKKKADNSSLKKDVSLYDHQKRAIEKVKSHDGNLILSHGTGSGKTLTAIAAFESLREDGKATKALVVTPASLRANFIDNGVRKFTTSRASIIGNSEEAKKGIARSLDDPDPGSRYHVISYEMFSKDPEKAIKATGADTVIYDELHRIRNDQGVTYKTIKDARKHHRNFIGLTGSLMNNTPADLVPLVDAMTDGNHRLGTKARFETRFISESKGGKKINKPQVVKALLNPFVDHFETKDLSDAKMPKKVVEEVKVMMSPYQEELYRYVVNKMDPITAIKFRLGTTKLKTHDISNIFSQIIQARQVSNSPHTIDLSLPIQDAPDKSPKVKKLLDDVEEHLKETSDGQVVIHSNLIKGGVDVLSEGLKQRNIPFSTFVGKGQPGVTEDKRQKGVEEFNSGKKRVIVISAAGGEGLDLRNATMFAGLDGHFNPEKVNQAESRAVRAGGLSHRPEEDRRVIVKRYVSVVPRSITQTLLDTSELISPSAIFKRVSTPGTPIFYNPFKRERSPDEWMSEVASNKDILNKQFREQLKTSAADEFVPVDYVLESMSGSLLKVAKLNSFCEELEKISSAASSRIPYQPYRFVKSDHHIMSHYWDKLGPEVEKMDDPYTEELSKKEDQIEEQKHVEALRAYYREAAKSPPGTMSAKNPLSDSEYLKPLLLGSAAGGAVMGIPLSMNAIEVFEPKTLKHTLGIGAAAVGGTALLSAGLAYHMARKNPSFTTAKSKAKKLHKLPDQDLRAMLRGLSIKEEVVKTTEHYIK
jgi:superfamily II DNA/RNA helicase